MAELKHNVNNLQQGFQLPKGLAAINFMADWHEPCIHMNSVFEELSRSFPWILYFQADAEECEDLAESFGVEQVPTFVVVQDGKKVDQVVGANAPALNSMIQKHAKSNAPHGQIQSKKQEAGSTENLDEKLKNLINSQPVMIFIKGVPSAPQCGFSRQLIEILSETKCSYGSFNILEDDQVRQGLKTYSNWPTFPQVYIKGELIGGLDIVKELVASGEFEKMLPDLNARLTHLTTKAPVMLFMKGSPDVPKCGFSRVLVGILKDHNIKFESFDILEDDEVRQGLKTFSNWPTFPQLYVKGELVGGLDIVKELVNNGEFQELFQYISSNYIEFT